MPTRPPLRIAFVGPTRNRSDLFAEAVAAIRPQVDKVITVTHGSFASDYAAPLVDEAAEWNGEVNISSMWSAGLDLADKVANGAAYDVAVINDDAIVEPTWFTRLAEAMHAAGAAGASGSRQEGKLATMSGYAFLLDGTKGIRADERMRWWFSDDAIQSACTAVGGCVIVNGVGAVNKCADFEIRADPTLRVWAQEDRQVFNQFHGEFVGPWNIHRGKGCVPLVISAPSGQIPTHLLANTGDRQTLVLTTREWEDQHLRYAASAFDWFVFLKESTRLLDPTAFWAAIDARTEPGWLFAPPSCYMALYSRVQVNRMTTRIRVHDKWGSIRAEASMVRLMRMHDVIWPEVTDANALRFEDDELVIGNSIIEKSKGSAWCGHCRYTPPGVCEHLR